MKILDIYKNYKIPPNLQEHLLHVAKIGLFICEHWIGPKINPEQIEKACLLHDLGNIVKFDFKKYPEFLKRDESRLDYWLEVQREVIERYGADDHEATAKMLEEIGIDREVRHVIMEKSFGNSLKTEKSDSWELKILFYSDLRVGPFGILSLKERLDEALGRLKEYKKRDNLDDLVKACRRIEAQIQANIDIKVSEISDKSIKVDVSEFLNLEV